MRRRGQWQRVDDDEDAFNMTAGESATLEAKRKTRRVTLKTRSGRPYEIDEQLRDQLMAEHERRMKEDAALYTDPPLPIAQCSIASVLTAVLIWALIGCAVWYRIYHSNGDEGSIVYDESGRSTTKAALMAAKAVELPAGCSGKNCHGTGFGHILGAHNGVFGFSNCNHDTCISHLENTVMVNVPESMRRRLQEEMNAKAAAAGEVPGEVPQTLNVSSGIKWQCVEYARRYWMLAGKPEPAYFGSVHGASDIWDELQEAILMDGSRTPLLKYRNGFGRGTGGSKPAVGDLVIYPRDKEGLLFPYGHVAVIVGVEDTRVFLAEQNWAGTEWPGPFHNYSRVLPLKRTADGGTDSGSAYYIEDAYHEITGWVRYAQDYDPHR